MFVAGENRYSPKEHASKKQENEMLSADANTKNSDTIDTCVAGVKRPATGKKLHLRVSK